MDLQKEVKELASKLDKDDVKKVANQVLDSKVADTVIDKVNEKTKKVDIKKEDVKNAINSVLK